MSVFYNSPRFYEIKPLQKEKWLPLGDFENNIWVSNMGRIKAIACQNRNNRKRGEEYIIPQFICGRGYLTIGFCYNGKNYMKSVHRLVALLFIPNPLNKKTVNHKKGIKIDNRATELEWATYSEQEIHSLKLGLRKTGSAHFATKLTDEDVLFIKTSNMKQNELAKKFGISTAHINNIIKGKRRKNEYS